ncbi:hypothetical protein [Scytonema sp. PCC 10023]|uniref:hypothetical protein n=1 Tax=Scytonema sp. PCC 10023 TaxID=1680591 RepID=UPI0039C699DB
MTHPHKIERKPKRKVPYRPKTLTAQAVLALQLIGSQLYMRIVRLFENLEIW